MSEVLKIQDESVDEITLVAKGLPYRSGKRAENKETYRQYRYEGKIFVVSEDDPFNVAFDDNRKITSVKLLKGSRTVKVTDEEGNETEKAVDTLTFDSFISFGQEKARALHNVQMDTLKRVSTIETLDEATVTALMNAAV